MTTDTKPRVLNKRDGNIPDDAVYVGRSKHAERGKWGNPFKFKKSDGVEGRLEVISQYKEHIDKEIASGSLDASELEGKDLVCWCAPEPCHADYLLMLANPDMTPEDTEEEERTTGEMPVHPIPEVWETTLNVDSFDVLQAGRFLTTQTAQPNKAFACIVSGNALYFTTSTGDFDFSVKIPGEAQVGPDMISAYCLHDIRKTRLLTEDVGEGLLEVKMDETSLTVGDVTADIVEVGPVDVAPFFEVALLDSRDAMLKAANEVPEYAARDGVRPIIGTVNVVKGDDSHVKMVSTDGYRICEFLVPGTVHDEFESMNIPREAFAMISKVFAIDPCYKMAEARISKYQTRMRFENDVAMVTVSSKYGPFPNTKGYGPKQGHKVIVQSNAIKKAVDSIFSFDKSVPFTRIVPYKDDAGMPHILLQATSEFGGVIETRLPASFEIDDDDLSKARVALKPDYLKRAISSANGISDRLQLEVEQSEKPVRVTPWSSTTEMEMDSPSIVVMPYSVKWS